MVKGVSRVDDAKRVVDLGATALSVSNHGGNNLDGTPAPLRALPAVVDAVGDQIEVLLDGGVRRGSDVVKALALGAKAVMIGRAYLWGLAANGQAGVENVLDVMRGGIDSTLLGLGKLVQSTNSIAPTCSPPRTSFGGSGDDPRRDRDRCRARHRCGDGRRARQRELPRGRGRSLSRHRSTFPTPSARRQILDGVVARHGDAVLGLVGDVRSATDMQTRGRDRDATLRTTRRRGGVRGSARRGRPALGSRATRAWDAVWSVNVLGTRRLIEAAAPVLIANGRESQSAHRGDRVGGGTYGPLSPRRLQRREARRGRTRFAASPWTSRPTASPPMR